MRLRKSPRLKQFDYGQNGVYFITICTRNRECLFGDVGADSISARMVRETFEETTEQYDDVECPCYVLMPNHFHCMLIIEHGDRASMTTISNVVQSFKRHTTIKYIAMVKQNLLPPFEKKIWQRSFHDHIVRDEQSMLKIYEYIENNQLKWGLDCHNPESPKFKKWGEGTL